MSVMPMRVRDDAGAFFREDFAANAADLPGAGLAWLDERREAAMTAFAKAGVPHRRVEGWKYTDLSAVLDGALEPAAPYRVALARAGALADPFASVPGPRLVLVNGFLAPASSGGLPEGVEIVDLSLLSVGTPQWVSENLGRAAADETAPMGALALALMRGGVAIRVRRGAKIAAPLHLAFLTPDREQNLASHARLLILLEEGAALTLVESHLGEGAERTLANIGMEIVLGAGAYLDHVRLQAEAPTALHVATAVAGLASKARYRALFTALGAKLSRVDLTLHLNGEESEATLHSVAALADEAHTDVTTLMDHAVPRTRSRQVFKSVLGGRARAVSQGRVSVRQGAVKSDSHQLFKSLLLSPGAEADAKPELEILADDVLCGHGAAIGSLDEEALFYLRARGISEGEARALLVRAFLEDAIEGFVPADIHEALWRKLDSMLPVITGEGV